MATDSKTVVVVPLNYAIWKLQCWMALVKDGLWSIVKGTEVAPGEGQADLYAKFIG